MKNFYRSEKFVWLMEHIGQTLCMGLYILPRLYMKCLKFLKCLGNWQNSTIPMHFAKCLISLIAYDIYDIKQ